MKKIYADKAKKWHYLKEDCPVPLKFTLNPTTIPVIIINKEGYEIYANYIDFSVPGFFGTDHMSVTAIAWRYRLNTD